MSDGGGSTEGVSGEDPLPVGWAWSTIGELLSPQSDGRQIHQGWSPKCDKQPSGDHDEWGVLKTTAIQGGSFEQQHNKRLPVALAPRPLLEVAAGDLLLTCAGPRQRCGVATLVRQTRPRLMISGKMYRFRFDGSAVLSEFVEYYLQSAEAWHLLDQMKTGGSESGLNLTQSRFRTLPVPVPPLAEQEGIVAAIEEHLSHLGIAEAALEDALRKVWVAEQSVLDTAVDGDPVRLGDRLAEPLRNGFSAARSEVGDTKVLTLTAVTKRAFTEDNTKLAVVPDNKRSDLFLRPDDVLVQRSNTPELVGTAALYSGPTGWAVFPDLLIRVRPDETLLAGYLELALRTSESRKYFRQSAQGIAGSMPKISQSTINDCVLRVPASVPEQREILDAVGGCLQAIARLRADAGAGQRRARSLRRSILAAAFSGRLVPQNPADASADALLAQIAAERPQPKARRSKKQETSR